MDMHSTPFTLLLVETNDDQAAIIELTAKRALPDVIINRSCSLESAIADLKTMTPFPSLILIASHRYIDKGVCDELKVFINHANVRPSPIVLLKHSGSENQIRHYYRQGIAAYHEKPETYDEWKILLESIRAFWSSQAQLPSR